MRDLAEDPESIGLIKRTIAAGKPVDLVCHAPGVLRQVKGVTEFCPRAGKRRLPGAGAAPPQSR